MNDLLNLPHAPYHLFSLIITFLCSISVVLSFLPIDLDHITHPLHDTVVIIYAIFICIYLYIIVACVVVTWFF